MEPSKELGDQLYREEVLAAAGHDSGAAACWPARSFLNSHEDRCRGHSQPISRHLWRRVVETTAVPQQRGEHDAGVVARLLKRSLVATNQCQTHTEWTCEDVWLQPRKVACRNTFPRLEGGKPLELWIVLEETPGKRDGYLIVFDEMKCVFGWRIGTATYQFLLDSTEVFVTRFRGCEVAFPDIRMFPGKWAKRR